MSKIETVEQAIEVIENAGYFVNLIVEEEGWLWWKKKVPTYFQVFEEITILSERYYCSPFIIVFNKDNKDVIVSKIFGTNKENDFLQFARKIQLKAWW